MLRKTKTSSFSGAILKNLEAAEDFLLKLPFLKLTNHKTGNSSNWRIIKLVILQTVES